VPGPCFGSYNGDFRGIVRGMVVVVVNVVVVAEARVFRAEGELNQQYNSINIISQIIAFPLIEAGRAIRSYACRP